MIVDNIEIENEKVRLLVIRNGDESAKKLEEEAKKVKDGVYGGLGLFGPTDLIIGETMYLISTKYRIIKRNFAESSSSLRLLLEIIANSPQLKSITISQSHLDPTFVKPFANAVSENDSIDEICLRNYSLNADLSNRSCNADCRNYRTFSGNASKLCTS